MSTAANCHVQTPSGLPFTPGRRRVVFTPASRSASNMINNSRVEYCFIRTCIVLLRLIGPASVIYTLLAAIQIWFGSGEEEEWLLRLGWGWEVWIVAEAGFRLFMVWFRRRLQHEAVHPPVQTEEERKAFFEKLQSELNDPERFLSGWFSGAHVDDIGREDIVEFLSWVFFEGRTTAAEVEELEEYTAKLEDMLGRKFKAGRGTAKGLRLTIDPIEIDCRSLLWYTLMMIVDTTTHIRMLLYKYEYFGTTTSRLGVFPPRPATLISAQKSPAKQMSYWLRPHTSKTRHPILFIHGIGVGLFPYVEFLHEIDQALNPQKPNHDEGQVGILAIEILPLSSRLTSPILTRDEFLTQLTQILHEAEFKTFVLVSHSYGSVSATHILTNPCLASRVASTLFIDPVTVLLHMPDVAFNFTRRKPKYANEWQLFYFGSLDPNVAYTLGRHFHWKQNLLWREQILALVDAGVRVTVSLASRDLIVDTQAVGTYLTQHRIPDPVVKRDKTGHESMTLETERNGHADEWKFRAWQGQGLEVLWYEGLDHAQVFDTPGSRARLLNVVVGYSLGEAPARN
ncbi:Hypothetical protein R9X50_00799700 [Acrodontium crateriforme]|uniref:AB hydrolase-1 domain-containing protein n=1 Tax=Acrodontium crateriforme TaxID=150365 RepID=A0AAQ3MDD8_9PEZI|nr:Hypothetical protein R9X50_00799700 [Acrodontium crateriforme]